MSLLDVEPAPVRGVIRMGTCPTCGMPDPVFGRPGEGRPLGDVRICHGHAIRA